MLRERFLRNLREFSIFSPCLSKEILDKEVFDEVIPVSSQDALDTARHIGATDGILVGGSAGAVIFAARQVAKELGAGKNILTLAPDNGERYLSTNLYEF